MNRDQITEIFIRAAEVDRKLAETSRPARMKAMTVGTNMTYAKVSKILFCDPIAGKLFWKARPMSMFKDGAAFAVWNKKHAGREAFTCTDENGYRCGGILGKKYRAHRIIWLLHYRKWPSAVIDHINGDPSDNRICNLRDVTQAENIRNTKDSRMSTGGTM